MSERKHRYDRRDSPEERGRYKRETRSSPRVERDDSGRNRRRSRSPHGRSEPRERERERYRGDYGDEDRRKHDRHKHADTQVKRNEEQYERREYSREKHHKEIEELRYEDSHSDRRKEESRNERQRPREPRIEERAEGRQRERRRNSEEKERQRDRTGGDGERQRDRTGGDGEREKSHGSGSDAAGAAAQKDVRQRRQGRREREKEEDVSQYEFGGAAEDGKEKDEKTDDPDYGLSGKLAAETNTFRGVVINYSEPPEARIPKTRWRLYPFKGDEALSTLYIHRQSAFLIGRDRRICDMPIDHPSCSKQHAVIQYRLVQYTKEDGSKSKRVRPYLLDLESTNGSYLNNQRIEPARYYELKEQDMLKFGFSSREYVILHENSKAELELDDGTE